MFLIPHAYTVPELARIIKALGTLGDYIVASVGLSPRNIFPMFAKISVFRKTYSIGSMTKEEKFKFYSGLIVQMRKIRR